MEDDSFVKCKQNDAGVGCLFVFKQIDMVADEEVHKMMNEMT